MKELEHQHNFFLVLKMLTIVHCQQWEHGWNFFLRPEENNEFYFSIHGQNNPNSIKSQYSVRFIVDSEKFCPMNGCQLLGTHSTCKYAVTKAHSSSCSKDEVDSHGRWKSDKSQQDTYANVTIPYVDARVASKLCKEGAITYQHVNGSGITIGFWNML